MIKGKEVLVAVMVAGTFFVANHKNNRRAKLRNGLVGSCSCLFSRIKCFDLGALRQLLLVNPYFEF